MHRRCSFMFKNKVSLLWEFLWNSVLRMSGCMKSLAAFDSGDHPRLRTKPTMCRPHARGSHTHARTHALTRFLLTCRQLSNYCCFILWSQSLISKTTAFNKWAESPACVQTAKTRAADRVPGRLSSLEGRVRPSLFPIWGLRWDSGFTRCPINVWKSGQ